MSLWKYSFELVTKELQVTKKKKKALDNLFSSNKISQATYNYLETELAKAVTDLENHLKTLMDKMTARAQELRQQMSTLELFLASLEIHHAAGDVDDETYDKQNNAILLGLEATRQELSEVRSSLSEGVTEPAEKPVAPVEPAETAEETFEAAEPVEIEKGEEPRVEEPSLYEPYEPVEPAEPSQEATTESAFAEPAESEFSSFEPYPSEEPFPEPETTSEF